MMSPVTLPAAGKTIVAIWMTVALSLLLPPVGAPVARAQEGEAARPDVLVLLSHTPQAGEVEGETDEIMGELLLRELVRQAVLIAARDELGLATRDAALREPLPEDTASESVVDITTLARHRHGIQVTMTHRGEEILDHEELCNIGPVNMYIELIEKMERLSRNEFRTVLEQTGLQGLPAVEGVDDADGAVSPEIDELLTEMNLLSQYEAVRLCHEQIRNSGESSQRLGALVRAYSHLGQMSQPYLSSMHRSIRARSLLYAQRLIAADPESPWGYWHRAYALSLAGIQRWSYSDLGRAKQLADAMEGGFEPPPWVELLDNYNRYDYEALKEKSLAGNSLSQLASMLWFISVETPSIDTESGVTAATARVRRPVGTIILAVLMVLSGLGMGAMRVLDLASAFHWDPNVVVHASYYVSLGRDGVTIASALLAAIGLFAGHRFGWWMAMIHGYWRIAVQAVFPVLGAIVTPRRADPYFSLSATITQALVGALVFSLIILYLNKKNVVAYFRGANAERLLTNVTLLTITGMLAFGFYVWIDILMQDPLLLP